VFASFDLNRAVNMFLKLGKNNNSLIKEGCSRFRRRFNRWI